LLEYIRFPSGSKISYHKGIGDLDHLLQATLQDHRFIRRKRVDGAGIEFIIIPVSTNGEAGGFIVDPVGVTDVDLSAIVKIRRSDLHFCAVLDSRAIPPLRFLNSKEFHLYEISFLKGEKQLQ
jgi:hypothetical protein